ncbi:AsmA-like C-terminal region-containing protein [Maridesulfovibrio sp.]|uniref:AsmA-like C-terminal region-containing protein n=1 Tax=Maridesulfovibrio sp. TaxID=2795000 RepID=UPI002A188CD3|nr:AsmA-like C-terminal region-containing protein [Maridesulfovibrio sp.]
MLRRKGLIIFGLVAAVLIIGSGVLVRVYFAEAAQKLLSEMTDMGIEMEDIEFHYSPLPSLRIRNLRVHNGVDTVSVPMLEIYPDIASLLTGDVRLRHVVLNDPAVQAAAHREGSADSGGDIVLPSVFPDRLDVVSGQLLLTDGYNPGPLTVSASMEKESQGFAFNVRSASIAELGFKFSGRLDMVSTSPLKLNLQATECAIDPAAFLGFLTGFGYMGNNTVPELADAGRFETTGLDFSVDSAAGTMDLRAGGLVLDSTEGKNLSMKLGQGGAFEVTLEEAKLDAGQLFAMAGKSERGRNATRSLCESAKLKSITPRGTLVITGLTLYSPAGTAAGKAKMSGKMTVSAKDLVLELESLEGRKQELSISDIDVDLEIKDGKPVVSVRRFNLASATGGSCNMQASLAFPFDMNKARFKAEALDFSLFDYLITCSAEKKNSFQTVFDTELTYKDTSISASGRLNTPRYKGEAYEAQLKSMSIRRPGQKDNDSDSGAEPVSKTADAQPFDFSPLLGRALSGKASIRKFYYNDWPFSDVAVYLQSGKSRAVLKASGKLFHLNLNADVVFAGDSMAAQCNVKGRGTSLPSLIACFAKDLSVSLRGRIYLNANMFVQGSNPEALAESARGDATAKIDGLQIFNLANLDPRLGFFIDFLDAVSMSPHAGEGLNFDSATLRAKFAGKKLVLNSFNFKGRILQAWGGGTYSLEDRRLTMDGQVRSVLGTVNSFNVDRKLKS